MTPGTYSFSAFLQRDNLSWRCENFASNRCYVLT
jgi:hypothetical protein